MVQSMASWSLMLASQAKVLPRWWRRHSGSRFCADVLHSGHGSWWSRSQRSAGDGARRESAGSGPDLDRLGQPGGGVPTEFGGVYQLAAVVGEQPCEQHLIPALYIEGVGDRVPQHLTWDQT